MEIMEAMAKRHSVRQYTDEPIDKNTLDALKDEIAACNEEGALSIQLVTNEPKAFSSFMAHYGKFSGVTDYIALIGKKSRDLDERCGYYGQRIVLKAQQLGLNTCWVALTYKKVPDAFIVNDGEKLVVVIALGYGKTQGEGRKSKAPQEVSNIDGSSPRWFRSGVAAALLAPTAMNQQKFYLTLSDDKVTAKAKAGFYTKLDLGIVKYHFELGAGKDNFKWA